MTDIVEIAASEFGGHELIDPKALAKISEDDLLDKRIVALARAGMGYMEIADQVGMAVPALLRRIAGLITLREDILSESMMNDYLIYQLNILALGIESAMADMVAQADPDRDVSESVASKTRQNGRLALVKFLQHQAVIMQLIRQRIDVNERKQVEIVVVRPEDWESI